MKVLLTGAHGQVGMALAQQASTLQGSGCQFLAMSRNNFDLESKEAMLTVLDNTSPSVIINAAAYTAVDKAESDADVAARVNAEAPKVMAEWAKDNDCLLIHFSTDYVFSGDKEGVYLEGDETAPRSIYGRTKLEGEQAIIQSGCRYIIFRTCWVYGAHGNNFLKTIVRLAHERQSISVVADQFGTPTSAQLIARVTLDVLAKYLALDKPTRQDLHGIYHLTAAGHTNWHQFAEKIVTGLAAQRVESCKTASVIPIPTEDYPTTAERPRNSRLSTAKLVEAFSVHLPSWEDEVSSVLLEILAQPGI